MNPVLVAVALSLALSSCVGLPTELEVFGSRTEGDQSLGDDRLALAGGHSGETLGAALHFPITYPWQEEHRCRRWSDELRGPEHQHEEDHAGDESPEDEAPEARDVEVVVPVLPLPDELSHDLEDTPGSLWASDAFWRNLEHAVLAIIAAVALAFGGKKGVEHVRARRARNGK